MNGVCEDCYNDEPITGTIIFWGAVSVILVGVLWFFDK